MQHTAIRLLRAVDIPVIHQHNTPSLNTFFVFLHCTIHRAIEQHSCVLAPVAVESHVEHFARHLGSVLASVVSIS